MAESDKRPKAKKDAKKAKRAKPVHNRESSEEADLIRALNHALRRQILRLLHASGGPLSPTEIERELELGSEHGDKLSTVSYHVATLRGFEAISKVDEQQVRGAMEHFYVSEVSKSAWVRDLLKRTLRSDESQLWPEGRDQGGEKAPKKKGR